MRKVMAVLRQYRTPRLCGIALSCLAVLVTVAALAGCGQKDLSGSKYVGVWVAVKVTAYGEEESMYDVFDGGETRLELKADGTVTGIMSGEELNCTWTETGNGIKLEGDVKATAKEDSDELILKVVGVSLHLVKES